MLSVGATPHLCGFTWLGTHGVTWPADQRWRQNIITPGRNHILLLLDVRSSPREVILNGRGISLKDAIIHGLILTRPMTYSTATSSSHFTGLNCAERFQYSRGVGWNTTFWLNECLRASVINTSSSTLWLLRGGQVPDPPDELAAYTPLFATPSPHPLSQPNYVHLFFITSDCDQSFLYGEHQCFCLPCVVLNFLSLFTFRRHRAAFHFRAIL